jgi:hypothetical protein
VRRARIRVLLEVGDVSQTFDHGRVLSFDLLLLEVVPAEVVEPSMLLDIVDPYVNSESTILQVAVPLREIGHQ